MMCRCGSKREQGFTLVVALVLLVMITLVVVMSFNLSQSNLKVVNNLQHRTEALNAAQQAIGTVLDTATFSTTPAAPLPVGKQCPGQPSNVFCTDANGDGNIDYVVTLTAACKKVRSIRNEELSLSNPSDVGCIVAPGQDPGVEKPLTGESLCSETLWEISAQANDRMSSATATAVQGVSVRIARDDADTSCP